MKKSMRKMLNRAVARVLKRLHYPLHVILTCVCWYVAYQLNPAGGSAPATGFSVMKKLLEWDFG